MTICALIGAVLVPSALAADPTPADFKNAAKYCKAVREAKGVDAFQTQYGTNKNKKERLASASRRPRRQRPKARGRRGAECRDRCLCKKQQSENATKFAQDYKNFGQCVKTEKAKTGTN